MPETENSIQASVKLCDDLISLLEDGKAQDIAKMDVSPLTTVADFMVVATGTSSRHVKSLAINAVDGMRDRGVRPRGIEGEDTGEWVLIDFGDVIVHIMQKLVREHYDLESLWQSGFNSALTWRAPDAGDRSVGE
jgi:ribosome-associated protein